MSKKSIAVIGGGPAGLMAAEMITAADHAVTVYDHMPSVGRKFLMAGRGGLNLTHSEDFDTFMMRYGHAAKWLEPMISTFSPQILEDWCVSLGQSTFVGSSGRVFPESLKASPLLRAWLKRLDQYKVKFAMRHRWTGWNAEKNLLFTTPDGNKTVKADAVVLALGGASWPKLGSDGGWVDILVEKNIKLARLQPANCGFTIKWSDIFRERAEGQALKPVKIVFNHHAVQGEAMITAKGIEGGAIYTLGAAIREAINAHGSATIQLDLNPNLPFDDLAKKLEMPRGSQSLSNHLRRYSGLSPVAISLLYESNGKDVLHNTSPRELAAMIKSSSLKLTGISPIERAISTAGGIHRDALDANLMLRQMPGVFAAGEMLDWEAPTGGYLLQATLSTAVVAANGLLHWINRE